MEHNNYLQQKMATESVVTYQHIYYYINRIHDVMHNTSGINNMEVEEWKWGEVGGGGTPHGLYKLVGA